MVLGLPVEFLLEQLIHFVVFLEKRANRCLTLSDRYEWPLDDLDQGARRRFYSYDNSGELVKLLVEHNLATTTEQDSKGRERKVRISFQDVDWYVASGAAGSGRAVRDSP